MSGFHFYRLPGSSTGKNLLPSLLQRGNFFPGEWIQFFRTPANTGVFPVALTLLGKPL